MSVYFQYGDMELWNPSSSVAVLFMRHVAALEKMVGAPSGLSPSDSDEIEVDAAALGGAFLDRLAQRIAQSNHRALLSLTSPAGQILCALYARCLPDDREKHDLLPGFFEAGAELIR